MALTFFIRDHTAMWLGMGSTREDAGLAALKGARLMVSAFETAAVALQNVAHDALDLMARNQQQMYIDRILKIMQNPNP
jgi:hypothetical protein